MISLLPPSATKSYFLLQPRFHGVFWTTTLLVVVMAAGSGSAIAAETVTSYPYPGHLGVGRGGVVVGGVSQNDDSFSADSFLTKSPPTAVDSSYFFSDSGGGVGVGVGGAGGLAVDSNRTSLFSHQASAAAMGNVTATPSMLDSFARGYSPIHGVVAPLICVLGIIANCLNIVVLTRKNMVSPTNVLLAALAISDGLTMVAYFPYAILNYHVYRYAHPPYGNAQYLMFFAVFSVIVHSISIWLTVSLAVFRYIFIRHPRHGVKLCSLRRAKFTVLVVCLVVTVVCIPNSVSYEYTSYTEDNQTGWYIDVKKDTGGYLFVKSFNLWLQAVLIKLLPCFLLSVLSILLIKQMQDAEKRRKKLLNKNGNKSKNYSSTGTGTGPGPGTTTGSSVAGKGERESSGDDCRRASKTNRTTRMLVTVVVLFVATETPQGILQLLGGVVDGFFNNIYGPLGDVMDTLALFNNGINFVLYCTMSKQFRDTFIKVFLRDLISDTSRRGGGGGGGGGGGCGGGGRRGSPKRTTIVMTTNNHTYTQTQHSLAQPSSCRQTDL